MSPRSRLFQVLMVFVSVWIPHLSNTATAESVQLDGLNRIVMSQTFTDGERRAARALQEALEELWGRSVPIERVNTADGGPGIYLGPTLAIEAGLISREQLESVQVEGFVIHGEGERLAVAGPTQQGTLYGAYTLLRRLGYHHYPWRDGVDGRTLVRIDANPPDRLEGLPILDRPFLAHRDLLAHVDRGFFRSTMREYVLADPRRAENPELFGDDRGKDYSPYTFTGSDFPDWFHTAGYLVPRDLYYASNPAYFATRKGKTIPPSRYIRSALCETSEGGRAVAAQRLASWMDLRDELRVFCVAPSDTVVCECDRCRASDPIPTYTTDRVMEWVNAIAGPMAQTHPDKTVFTGAYLQTVKPPLQTRLAPNVVVLYAAWFWNSRATSATTYESPLNMMAMEEFFSWLRHSPGQVGLYDYPSDEAFGTAARIKFAASHDVRHIYYNGAQGDLVQWLGSELSWDPFQDVEPLLQAYGEARYGPASEPMLALLRLRRATQERHGQHTRAVFSRRKQNGPSAPASYFQQASQLTAAALSDAQKTDPLTRLRVGVDVIQPWLDQLGAIHPRQGRPDLRVSEQAFAQQLAKFESHCAQVIQAAQDADLRRLVQNIDKLTTKSLEALKADASDAANQQTPASDLLFDPEANDDAGVAYRDTTSGAIPTSHAYAFDTANEASQWVSDASQPSLAKPVQAVMFKSVTGARVKGVRAYLPLSKLPVHQVGNQSMHLGRFYLERSLESALPLDGGHWVEFYVHATADVPVTLYVQGTHIDFYLREGEQMIRFDLRTLDPRRDDYRDWDGIKNIGLDVWAQDSVYPHSPAKDVVLTLLNVSTRNHIPPPQNLPAKKPVVWLSRFTPTVPHQLPDLNEWSALYQRQDQPGPTIEFARFNSSPQFRTFIMHGVLTPISRIVSAGESAEAAVTMQDGVERSFGVRLPIESFDATDSLANAIVLGEEPAIRSGQVDPGELDYVGEAGYIVKADRGRVMIAARDAAGLQAGVDRYLTDHHATCLGTSRAQFADLAHGYLHELFAVSRPWFPAAALAGMPRSAQGDGDDNERDVESVLALAENIKAVARRGDHVLPDNLLEIGSRSELARYVTSRLIRDPFDDAARAINRYMTQASHEQGQEQGQQQQQGQQGD